MRDEFATQVFLAVLKQLHKDVPHLQFSFDKMQTLFGKAYNRMISSVKQTLSPFASQDGMASFSVKLDELLTQAESARLIVAAGGNRNKFSVVAKVAREEVFLSEQDALVAKFFALTVVDVLKTKQKTREF